MGTNLGVKVPAFGPQPARILLVGEAPGVSEEEQIKPFVGASGSELTKMLNDAGILRSECRVTNVCKYRPPGNKIELWWPQKKKDITSSHSPFRGEYFDPRIIEGIKELEDEIVRTQPNVVVPLGNLPLWALTGETGLLKWRSSLLRGRAGSKEVKVIPTIHPAAVLRNWEWRYLAVHDLRRARRWSTDDSFPSIIERFEVAPSFATARTRLEWLIGRCDLEPTRISVDIETSKRHLACIGFAWSRHDAICIPLSQGELNNPYWTAEEELQIILLLRRLCTHPNFQGIGQNWQYDYQYIAKYWGFEINLFLDIMSEHHVQFPGLPKGLDFQSSLYKDIHIYWKDEGKEKGKGDDSVWWTYNCRDCVTTYECAEALLVSRDIRPLRGTSYGTPHTIQQRLSTPIARASARGVKKDHDLARKMAFILQEDLAEAERWLNRILGREFNCRSNPQMLELFYEELKQEKILHRKTRRPTLDDEALDTIAQRDILLRPLCQGINHIRTLSNFLSVCLQPTDGDGRLRCQYTIPGTETFRFASSSDPFGFGTNLQNISSGDRTDKDFPLPNLRRIFAPDAGYCIGEFDLPQADARVVAWEAEDEALIELFLDPSRHLHMENAELIFGRKIKKTDIEYYYAKQGVHLTNYGGGANVLSHTLGITMREAENFQFRWFNAHPKIKDWHRRVLLQLSTKRYVENIFGYRRFYFDRIDSLLKEALAWIPQSSVGIATNLAILQIDADEELRKMGLELLLQTHDSTTYQWPKHLNNYMIQELPRRMQITLPYARPLSFSPGIKISDKSWGDCEEVKG